jgi:hypothetical protein
LPETPNDPNTPESTGQEQAGGASPPTPAPAPPAEPVVLDLTANDDPSLVAPNVQLTLREYGKRTGETFDEVQRKAGLGASRQLGEQGSDKAPTYAPRDRAQDSARQIITLWLIGLFCVLITMAFAALFMIGLKSGFNDDFFTKLKSLLDVLLGPVITLLSSAIGFYFGYQQGAGTLGKETPKDGGTSKPGNGQ